MSSSLEQLVSMGFDRRLATICLEENAGDVQRACLALLGAPNSAPDLQAAHQVVQASISQYDVENGRSACTCICLEASLSLLECLKAGDWRKSPDDIGNIVSVGAITYEALVAGGTMTAEHTSVAEVLAAVARYRDVLRPGTLRGCYQGLLGSDTTFPHLLGSIKRDRQLRTHHIAVAITKPPETNRRRVREERLATWIGVFNSSETHRKAEGSPFCLLLKISGRRIRALSTQLSPFDTKVVAFLPPDEDIGTHAHGTQGEAAEGGPRGSAASQHWLLFDSHPRPQLGLTGASVQRFGEESALLAALVQIFPAVEVEAGNVLASMYNMVDCTPLVLRGAES